MLLTLLSKRRSNLVNQIMNPPFPSNQNPSSRQYQELDDANSLLSGVFNSLQIGISVFDAEKDPDGKIIDFRIKLANKEVERQTQRTNLKGIAYLQEYPGVRETGIFDLMLRVMDTGKPEQMEYYFPQPGFNKWYACTFAKMDERLIATNVELDPLRNNFMLRQTEEFAQVGSWEFDLFSQQFKWTGGMYNLFDLEKDSPIAPEVYLEFASQKSKSTAKKIVQLIRTAEADFEKVLEILVAGKLKTLKVSGKVIKNASDEVVAVVGVDLDISAQANLQQERLRVQNQLKEALDKHNEQVLRVTLKTQEEERRRISESLHNGLGQLLYGVKLSLDQLNSKMEDLEVIKLIKKNTDALLTQAIKETRRISHELSPSILETFGLKVAIQDICQQFNQALKIRCDLQDPQTKLSKVLELFIYRTIQELTTNIIKHANASEACIELFFSKDRVNIKIEDNGKGLKPGKEDGIGLTTIQSQLNLLKGTFKLSSTPGKGTSINISIPNSNTKANSGES
jgi:signal transduction histidine kinase